MFIIRRGYGTFYFCPEKYFLVFWGFSKAEVPGKPLFMEILSFIKQKAANFT